jgi:hypothetical protein
MQSGTFYIVVLNVVMLRCCYAEYVVMLSVTFYIVVLNVVMLSILLCQMLLC